MKLQPVDALRTHPLLDCPEHLGNQLGREWLREDQVWK